MKQFEIKHDYTNSFKRPRIKEDIKYRRIKKITFEDDLKQVLPQDCDLCFHGTTIWNTEKILKSKNISAEIDRVGKNEDVLDMSGKISVTTINNIWFTLQGFADLDNFDYPAGCIFVMSPKNKEEIKSSKDKNIINNVDFGKEPNRLKAIITTPENIQRVKTWLEESDLNISDNIVFDYDNFITHCVKLYKSQELSI